MCSDHYFDVPFHTNVSDPECAVIEHAQLHSDDLRCILGVIERELFLDPSLTFPKLTVARKLLLKKLGFRTLLDVIPLDTSLVKGSHGRVDQPLGWDPVLIADASESLAEDASGRIPSTSVKALLLSMLFD